MNIFATHPNPDDCARALDDKRLVKMVLETAQIICTVRHVRGLPAPYKPTHRNHPVVKWAGANLMNYAWTRKLMGSLSMEYCIRFRRVHASELALRHMPDDLWPVLAPGPASFANCARRSDLDLDFTHIPDTHRAYQLYLSARWDREQPRWTQTGAPNFYNRRPYAL